MVRALALLLLIPVAVAFLASTRSVHDSGLKARKRSSETGSVSVADFGFDQVGNDIPEEIAKQQAIYDSILVERFNAPLQTATGLFLPKVDGKDQKHVAKVLSVPTYGLESEQGRIQGPQEVCPYNVGDVVYVRDPWGIGPKDQQIGERCFSFHKSGQITGVIRRAAADA